MACLSGRKKGKQIGSACVSSTVPCSISGKGLTHNLTYYTVRTSCLVGVTLLGNRKNRNIALYTGG